MFPCYFPLWWFIPIGGGRRGAASVLGPGAGSARRLRAGEVGAGVSAERGDQAAAVVRARCEDDLARLDALQGDRGQVRAQAQVSGSSRDDRHGLPSGDALELVLDGLDQRAVGRGPSIWAWVDAPEG